ncbi:D-alanyl-D-alanine carboxypeptidase family protein [Cohnella lupini]|uniref:D-alanyl-D-alanine dipeptidase/carboxypeptidase n=1 Tax=Cohnella lupini TaxID=1294267 RepID=A0A3D9INC0_9BACL|nr:D-alanyl-D-alanine carboxypeptidase family protein [Cohnella lupini]RED63225.1 D-alanyl-D-alanine dipeptidase/carboxypeptidase [Cohnella lupini]
MTQWSIREEAPPAGKDYVSVSLEKDQLYDGPLVLVNRDHPVRTLARNIVALPSGILQASNQEEPIISLEATCLAQLSSLIRACRASTKIAVVSGYRSLASQKRLYENSLRDNGEAFTESYVALPGASEHQTGLAVDVGIYDGELDYIRPSFPDQGAAAIFKRLAAKFGFIQRYSDNKTHLTGIAAELWHFRYVGSPHAELMEREGLCLEEYTDFVRQYAYGGKHLYIETNETLSEIYFAEASAPSVYVPVPSARGESWQLSGNNGDGYVVTAAYPKAGSRHG